jgi:hypothetical protein
MLREITAIACLSLLVGSAEALAQNADGNDLLEHGQGLILDTEEDLAGIPRTPEYRAFLPDRIDLSDRFPAPGDQGRQNSCVAWSVGYAARAYYANKVEGRDIGQPTNIPSPAYIYDSIKGASSTSDCGIGSKISDALNLLGQGAISIKKFPYSEDSCRRPPNSLRARATDCQIVNWFVVDPKARSDQSPTCARIPRNRWSGAVDEIFNVSKHFTRDVLIFAQLLVGITCQFQEKKVELCSICGLS